MPGSDLPPADLPRVLVLTGVTGAGKTTVGKLLAEVLRWSFYDADDFHPAENVEWMRAGKPLPEEAREPWLDALQALIAGLLGRGESAVLACSALRKEYRDRLRLAGESGPGEVRFVFLRISQEEAERRLLARHDHFMPASLVDSQFELLEEPLHALRVDAGRPPGEIVHEIRAAWAL